MPKARQKLAKLLLGFLAVLSFVILSSVAVVWANGLRYNSDTGSFERTVIIAIDGDRNDVAVTLNGTQLSSQIPYRIRNILPGNYTLELTKPGFHTWTERFYLAAEQVHLIENPVLIANPPLVTTASNDLQTKLLAPLEYGIELKNGEITDQGTLVTRLSLSPVQVWRFNDYYLYQIGRELRLFIPNGTQDYLVYRADSSGQLPLALFPKTWQVAVADGQAIKLINLTIPATNAP